MLYQIRCKCKLFNWLNCKCAWMWKCNDFWIASTWLPSDTGYYQATYVAFGLTGRRWNYPFFFHELMSLAMPSVSSRYSDSPLSSSQKCTERENWCPELTVCLCVHWFVDSRWTCNLCTDAMYSALLMAVHRQKCTTWVWQAWHDQNAMPVKPAQSINVGCVDGAPSLTSRVDKRNSGLLGRTVAGH